MKNFFKNVGLLVLSGILIVVLLTRFGVIPTEVLANAGRPLIQWWEQAGMGDLISTKKPPRVWTSKVGTTVKARLVGVTESDITLEKEDGSELVVKRADFSEADQTYLARKYPAEQKEATE